MRLRRTWMVSGGRNIYAHLEEMQVKLERLGIQQYGMAQTGTDEQFLSLI